MSLQDVWLWEAWRGEEGAWKAPVVVGAGSVTPRSGSAWYVAASLHLLLTVHGGANKWRALRVVTTVLLLMRACGCSEALSWIALQWWPLSMMWQCLVLGSSC